MNSEILIDAHSVSHENNLLIAEFLFATSKRDIDRVRKLIDSGLDVNLTDYDRRTAAHLASGGNDVDMLKLLFEAGANFNLKDRWNNYPLDDAIIEESHEAIEFLKSKNASSGSFDHYGTVHPALERTFPSPETFKLLHAASLGLISVIEQLVLTSDIDASDYDKRTALHVAASDGQVEVVRFLMAKGALINTQDRWGATPLDDAIRGKFVDVIEILREHGGESAGYHLYDLNVEQKSEELRKLQEIGIRESWAVRKDDINRENSPFARGAGGELYFACWRGLKVVVKSCENMIHNKQALTDLGNEISLLSTLRHPNLIMFLGASFEAYPPLLVIEYAAGGTLESYLMRASRNGHCIPKIERMRFSYELALAMNFLHLCNPPIIHRDLKPNNVLLTADKRIRVSDFGLSKFFPTKTNKHNDTFAMTGETGSYRYMAVEVFNHEQYNEKVDVYSFGLILYWIHTGIRPFHGLLDLAAVKAAVGGMRPTFSNAFAKPISEIIMSCWRHTPDHRPAFSEILVKFQELGYDSPTRTTKNCCVS